MKKVFVAILFAGVMVLSFAVPAMANTAVTQEAIKIEASYQEIVPFFEFTSIYHRWSPCGCGRLQFRVWGRVENGSRIGCMCKKQKL